jgi:hypothetical protein
MKARRAFPLLLVAFVAVACPQLAVSKPVSSTFAITGYEYAFTSTVGNFAGNGSGNAGGSVYWNASVKHDRLGSAPTYVNGGSFAMAVRGPGDTVDAVVGILAYHGGTITTLRPGLNCTNQEYLVTDTVEAVRTSTTSNGSGALRVTLTHYRHRVLGRCIAYKAKVTGVVSVTY